MGGHEPRTNLNRPSSFDAIGAKRSRLGLGQYVPPSGRRDSNTHHQQAVEAAAAHGTTKYSLQCMFDIGDCDTAVRPRPKTAFLFDLDGTLDRQAFNHTGMCSPGILAPRRGIPLQFWAHPSQDRHERRSVHHIHVARNRRRQHPASGTAAHFARRGVQGSIPTPGVRPLPGAARTARVLPRMGNALGQSQPSARMETPGTSGSARFRSHTYTGWSPAIVQLCEPIRISFLKRGRTPRASTIHAPCGSATAFGTERCAEARGLGVGLLSPAFRRETRARGAFLVYATPPICCIRIDKVRRAAAEI